MTPPLIDQLPPSAQSAAPGFALWNLGFRPFYLFASVFSGFGILLWTALWVAGRILVVTPWNTAAAAVNAAFPLALAIAIAPRSVSTRFVIGRCYRARVSTASPTDMSRDS
jgi:uncharacterized protein involved in response to NO